MPMDFDVCVVGQGPSATFYLHTYNARPDLRDHVVWTSLNPWMTHPVASERFGRGRDYSLGQSSWINSVKNQRVHSTALMRREDFYAEQSEILSQARTERGLTFLVGWVRKIEALGTGGYQVSGVVARPDGRTEERTLRVNKILLMMGNGAERVPTPEDGIHIWPRPENNPRVFSLDAYMRMVPYGFGPNHESLEGKTVVVHGGNAAIDAVQQSFNYGMNVVWLTRGGAQVLPDTPLTLVDLLASGGRLGDDNHYYTDVTGLIVMNKDGRLGVRITSVKQPAEGAFPARSNMAFDADFYVYALGQDARVGPTGVQKLLTDSGLVSTPIKDTDFEPIPDRNFVLYQPRSPTERYDGILGLRKPNPAGGYVDILGAASIAALPPTSKYIRRLKYGVYHQVGAVLDVRQIGGIRAVMKAYNSHVEAYSDARGRKTDLHLNYFAAMPDDIAAFLAARYDMTPTFANMITDFLLWVRVQPGNTNGFQSDMVGRIEQALERSEAISLEFETAAKRIQKEWETVFGVTWPSESQRHQSMTDRVFGRPPRPVRERPRVSGGQSCQVEFLSKGGSFKG